MKKFIILLIICTTLIFSTSFIHADSSSEFNLAKFEPSTVLIEEGVKFPTYDENGDRNGYYIADIKTKINDNIDTIHTEAFLINHYYNKDGEYITSKTVYSAYHKDKHSKEVMQKDVEEEIPHTMLKSFSDSTYDIESIVEELTDYKSIDFIKTKALDEEPITTNDIEPTFCQYSCHEDDGGGYVEAAGTFDNYYRNEGNKYVVQALGGTRGIYMNFEMPHSSLNTRSFNEYKTMIDLYEYYVIQSMNYNTWPDKVNSFSANIAKYTAIGHYAGKILKGPTGWVDASKYLSYAHWTTKFTEFTSEAYANGHRLSASLNAMEYLHDAQRFLATSGNRFENTSFTQKYGWGYW